MWIGYPHMPTELVELELFKLFCCKTWNFIGEW
jgi:hypothetical protein